MDLYTALADVESVHQEIRKAQEAAAARKALGRPPLPAPRVPDKIVEQFRAKKQAARRRAGGGDMSIEDREAMAKALDSSRYVQAHFEELYNLYYKVADQAWIEWTETAKARHKEITALRSAIVRLETRMIKLAEVVEIARNLTLAQDEGGRGYYAVQGCGKDAELLAEALKALDSPDHEKKRDKPCSPPQHTGATIGGGSVKMMPDKDLTVAALRAALETIASSRNKSACSMQLRLIACRALGLPDPSA